jgi:hypothetical protein
MMRTVRWCCAAIVGALWALFLWLDYLWQQVLEEAVTEQRGFYGELYGPLSFFRPLALWLALGVTILALVMLVRR